MARRASLLEDRVIDTVNYTVLTLAALVTLYPFLHVLTISLAPPELLIARGAAILWPTKVTLAAYTELFQTSPILRAFLVSVLRTSLGTALNVGLTALTAYPLARRTLPGRSVLLLLIVFTMLFNGGIIPTYLVVKGLGLVDSIWALILPTAINAYYLIIMKNYFEGLPEELFEAASTEGASDLQILTRVVLPLSRPILATLGLFYAVYHWNAFFDAIMFINDRAKYPLQVLLREIVVQGNVQDMMGDTAIFGQNMKMAVIVVTTLPVLFLYPFIQRYFTKGIMIGAIKG